jgi:hypothetical protein
MILTARSSMTSRSATIVIPQTKSSNRQFRSRAECLSITLHPARRLQSALKVDWLQFVHSKLPTSIHTDAPNKAFRKRRVPAKTANNPLLPFGRETRQITTVLEALPHQLGGPFSTYHFPNRPAKALASATAFKGICSRSFSDSVGIRSSNSASVDSPGSAPRTAPHCVNVIGFLEELLDGSSPTGGGERAPITRRLAASPCVLTWQA